MVNFLDLSTAGITDVPRVIALVRSCTIETNPPFLQIWNHPAFLKLLKLFVVNETFNSLTLHAFTAFWPDIKDSTRTAFHALVRTPHLRTLSLHRFGRVLSDLFDGSTLKNLHLYCAPDPQARPLSELASPPLLETLVADNMFPILKDPLRSGFFPFPHLKKLVLDINQESHTDVAYGLARGSRYLHELELIFTNYRVWVLPEDRPFDLGQLPSLRHIKLVMHVRGAIGTKPLKKLWRFLASPLAANTPVLLETIEFEVTHEILSNLDGTHWKALDNAISQRHLSHVRKVHVKAHFHILGLTHFRADFSTSALEEKRRQLFNTFFPRARSNKAIDFTIQVEGEIVARMFWSLY
ncbi:hypothetical protein HYPSUDRAFT_69903 [Hypholoma sublateritium FD-334 SS-4]|uniref:F-box domain-containing protein n=1 Tax=Hypholoma sublateritium (strain FD-334 SS-4) TaxID=945553 RepID=A0A0D2PDS8_HYPSF|nr:hypothetical protein HYPSUDRAFT_69903 [Hypholoma sublateritium FD-334 SS-4]